MQLVVVTPSIIKHVTSPSTPHHHPHHPCHIAITTIKATETKSIPKMENNNPPCLSCPSSIFLANNILYKIETICNLQPLSKTPTSNISPSVEESQYLPVSSPTYPKASTTIDAMTQVFSLTHNRQSSLQPSSVLTPWHHLTVRPRNTINAFLRRVTYRNSILANLAIFPALTSDAH